MKKMRKLEPKKATLDSPMEAYYPPTFTLPDEKIPEAKTWEVGKKYKMEIEVEMVGTNKDEYLKSKKITHRFKITQIGVEQDDEEMKGKRGNDY